MQVTKLEEPNKKKKIGIYIDGEYAFMLYESEVHKLNLCEGFEISTEQYENIVNNTIYPMAKQKAVDILKFMDRTEMELRKKLSEAGFTQEIIDRTVDYINEYGYLNDERFAKAYLKSRMNTKSKLIIKTELIQKGVSKDIIKAIFEEEYDNNEAEDPETNAIRKAIAKKTRTPEDMDYNTKQKLIASLYRKGFDIGKIKQILNNNI